MKLFIINQGNFIKDFPLDGNTTNLSHKKIHSLAFNKLSKAISEGQIPLKILIEYRDDCFAILDFRNRIDDIYYYSYN